MNILLKRAIFSVFLMLLLGISNSYGQSESEKIDELIEQKRAFNKHHKNSTVYKIQLYNGIESEAVDTKEEFDKEFPEYKAVLKYKAPEWKTQVGEFKTRLKADRILLIIKKKFPSAIVLEDRI